MLTETIPCKGVHGIEPFPTFLDAGQIIPRLKGKFDHLLSYNEQQAVDNFDPLVEETFNYLVQRVCVEFGWRV